MVMKGKDILMEQIINQVPGNIVSDMAGEKVMLSVEKGKYFNLGEVGGEIWSLIEEKKTVNQLVSELVEQYDVEFDKCKSQVLTFLEVLREEELIQII
ncbi:lasso peptide biosynthesis PqqD family chaperone [Metabacillus litoralis]|nr:lasso peptide biosynthesis PqqD family chaperone [Metabacillus litoralis]MCM3161723.1 lasso peptide biosynthesis PqqD family chaperone [Metabacillus litoralis]